MHNCQTTNCHMQATHPFPLSQIAIDTHHGPLIAHVSTGEGSCVVCWPSLMGDHHSMLEFAAQLAPEHRVVMIDPPGCGANKGFSRQLLLSEQIDVAQKMLVALQADNCHWVGHGYGGLIGVGLASRDRHSVRSITLSSVPFVQTARVSVFAQPLSKMLCSFAFGRKYIAKLFAKQISAPKSYERKIVQDTIFAYINEGNIEIIKQLRPVSPLVLEQLRAKLPQLAVPTLLIAGQDDRAVLKRDQHTTAEIIPNARYQEVNSNFMTFLVRPRECAQIFKQFVYDIESTSKPSPLQTQF